MPTTEGVKTAEQVREELAAIHPDLPHLYEIVELDNGVQLKRGETSIVTGKYIPECEKGLFEIYPRVGGSDFETAFRAQVSTYAGFTLREAVKIAEYCIAAEHSPLIHQELEKLSRKYFGKRQETTLHNDAESDS